MDKIYVGSDIPLDYCYAIFGDNYIDLYNQSNIQGSLDFYRLYMYDNIFVYDHKFNIYDNDNSVIASYVRTTDSYLYRRDIPSIAFLSVVFVLIIIFLVNLMTSCIKKGGLFGELL